MLSRVVRTNSTLSLKVGKRGAWLVQITEQAPPSVTQEPWMEPYSVWNTAAVPSGTGLLNLSAMRTVISLVMPSNSRAPRTVSSVADRLIEFWSGRPVVTASTSETVDKSRVPLLVSAMMVAITRTAVATLPDCTVALTMPSVLETARVRASDRPPMVVLREKSTATPWIGTLSESDTIKVTTPVSCRPLPPPVPRRASTAGSALSKTIEVAPGGATVMLVVAVLARPAMLAVTVSVPEQPATVYSTVTRPSVVVADTGSSANPDRSQSLRKRTSCSVLTGSPSPSTTNTVSSAEPLRGRVSPLMPITPGRKTPSANEPSRRAA